MRENADWATETLRQWAGEAEAAGNAAKEAAGDAARKAGDKLEEAAGAVPTGEQGAASATAADFAADAVGEKAGPLGAQGAEAADATKEAASRAADEVSRQADAAAATAGGLLSGLRSTAVAALGAMLGPLEREGAFDGTAAVVTGPSEPIPVERLSADEAARLDRARGAVEGDAVRVAGEKTDRALGVRDAGGRDARRSEGSGPSAGAPVGDEELGVADKVKDRAQAALDDAATAAGAAFGHAEAAAAQAAEALARQQDHGPATLHIGNTEVELREPFAPAAPPSNTEDILAERARAAAAQAEEDAARGPARV
ncbi:hypothetical protein MNEG_14461 [Monoraphidium neglectum]|uniref:Uncharacterized protein n=1 Tax=Monoraphidium neglectum TaxID=145388 RepID=A0A0D2LV50_9CHLO|nr:hypothetical protein MNEG_14461 [Monoraphidium neglectum]KIY93501.1 hypothetical protein MNEG_14461 [Monoraphidium neglectum]|eukprot:XP_013892521.1 hypothetical protein MNEG_14461 [Monoraphidium neglectum]